MPQLIAVLQVLNPLEDEKVRVKIPVEPSFVGVGTRHAVCGMNNRAWFFNTEEESQ